MHQEQTLCATPLAFEFDPLTADSSLPAHPENHQRACMFLVSDADGSERAGSVANLVTLFLDLAAFHTLLAT